MEDKEKGSSSVRGGNPRRRARILVVVAMLVAGFMTLYLIVIPYYTYTMFVDVRAGRRRSVTQIYLVPIKDETHDTFFTQQHRKYVSNDLLAPEWWYESDCSKAVWGKTLSDSFDTGPFQWVEGMQCWPEPDRLLADDDAWRAFMETFTRIYDLNEEKRKRQFIGEAFEDICKELRRELGRPLSARDLPSLEEVRREAEDRTKEWGI